MVSSYTDRDKSSVWDARAEVSGGGTDQSLDVDVDPSERLLRNVQVLDDLECRRNLSRAGRLDDPGEDEGREKSGVGVRRRALANEEVDLSGRVGGGQDVLCKGSNRLEGW